MHNRNAKFVRDGFVLNQLDGEGMEVMEGHQEMAMKGHCKDNYLRSSAVNNEDSTTHPSFRTANEGNLRQEKINDMLQRANKVNQSNKTKLFDMSSSQDDMEPPQSTSSDDSDIKLHSC